MLEVYFEGKNLVNGIETKYPVVEGATFVSNYNETLDSGTIILAQLSSKIQIEPYDVAVVKSSVDDTTREINDRVMLVDKYVCTKTGLNPTFYKYEITLMSLTKMLEGIICPSLAITKLAGDERMIYYYLVTYNNLFGEKAKSTFTYLNKLSFTARVQTKFSDIVCPELQWNEPTLREVFTDLMMVADCIPVVIKDNGEFKIDYMDISEIGSEIPDVMKTNINYITQTRSSDEYISGLKMKLVNSINGSSPSGAIDSYDDSDIPKDSTRLLEYIGFRNSDDYILTTENVRLETAYPIWRLYYVEAKMKVTIDATIDDVGNPLDVSYKTWSNVVLYSDTQKFILEHGEWRTKNIYYAGFNASQVALSTDYQNTCLYYKRGSKGIHNFNAKVSGQILFIPSQVSLLELIGYRAEVDNLAELTAEFNDWLSTHYPSYHLVGDIRVSDVDYKSFTFLVSYETLGDDTFIASKMSDNFTHNRIVADNQTNSYIDINRQGLLEYLKANRLGNEISIVNARYETDEWFTPDLARQIDGEIIFRKEIAVYNNYIKANYQTTKDYVLKNYFTSIKSKLRSWRIVDGSDALLRAENKKFFINDNLTSISTANEVIPVYSDLDTYLENFKYCAISFKDKNNNTIPSSNNILYNGINYGIDAYLVEFTKHKCGNSVLFTIKMPDNMFLGKYIYNANGTGGMQQKDAKYTDDDGEFVSCVIEFYETESMTYSTYNEFENRLYLLPAIKKSVMLENLVAKIPINIWKDNKEILQITIQFEQNEYATDIKVR